MQQMLGSHAQFREAQWQAIESPEKLCGLTSELATFLASRGNDEDGFVLLSDNH